MTRETGALEDMSKDDSELCVAIWFCMLKSECGAACAGNESRGRRAKRSSVARSTEAEAL